MGMVRPESKLDEGSRIRRHGALPALVGLVALHSFLRGIIPHAGRAAIQVVFANERLLNVLSALRINFLLSFGTPTGSALALFVLNSGLVSGIVGWGTDWLAGLRLAGAKAKQQDRTRG